MTPKICLGTAQFGLSYGITNVNGQISETNVKFLLEDAVSEGITFLDTAQSYGNAESVLGRTLPFDHPFGIVSKLPAQKQSFFSTDDCVLWEKSFSQSLEQLGVEVLDAFLVHHANDLRKNGSGYLYEWLLGLQERKLVRRIGVSIYERSDLDYVPLDLIKLVQLPLSLYDQRLLNDGTIAYLRDNGCSIHARSIYLQGLLLSPASSWPDWVELSTRVHHERLETFSNDRDGSLLDCALGFAKAQQDLEAVVVGISSRTELIQLMRTWHQPSPWEVNEWSKWSLDDPKLLDPRFWS